MGSKWEVKRLVDIGKIYNGNSINEKIKKDKYTNIDVNGYPYIATKDVGYDNLINYDNGIKVPLEEKELFKIAPSNTILICAEGGSAGRKIGFTDRDICFGNKLFALTANKNINSRFIYYWYFSSNFQKHFSSNLSGIIGGVSLNKFKEINISVPPLIEQQHIVTILDKAFTTIAKAKENAEKNLQNARDLFESSLQSVFTKPSEGWVNTTLENVLTVQPRNGWSPPSAHHSSSGIPVLTLSSVTGFQFRSNKIKFTSAQTDPRRHYWVKNGDFLITRSNTPELVGHVAIAVGLTEQTIYPDLIMRMTPDPDRILTKFLYYQMRSPLLRETIMNRARGANPTMKKISKSDVQTLPIVVPPISAQQAIVTKLYALSLETKKLEAIYKKKLAALEELKKSLLQKAFSGELTAQSSVSNVIPFPITIPNITTTDMHAGVLAIAYQQHENTEYKDTFTDIKAEKISHMIEAYVGIDLERKPVKNAAGPNDYPHLKKVESRAKKAEYFLFGRNVTFKKHNNFISIIKKTQTALCDYNQKVDSLIQIMLPMSEQQAEIFATVFAAWNNLLITGEDITDEAIVYEARENWHEAKLKIERKKFFDAINWMKEKNIIPEGKGKLVGKVAA